MRFCYMNIEIAFWIVIGGTLIACLLRPSLDLIQDVQFAHQPAYLDAKFKIISQASLISEADLRDSC